MNYLQLLPEESVTIEYKANFTYQIGNTICAFLNTIGGKIFLSINEKSIISQPYHMIRNDINMLLNYFAPESPSELVEIKTEIIMGNEIMVISVSQAKKDIIYSYRGEVFYRRQRWLEEKTESRKIQCK